MILPGPIYEHEGVDKSKLSEYALGRDKRLVVRRVGHLVTYTLHDLLGGTQVQLSPKDVERLMETLSVLLVPRQSPESSSPGEQSASPGL